MVMRRTENQKEKPPISRTQEMSGASPQRIIVLPVSVRREAYITSS